MKLLNVIMTLGIWIQPITLLVIVGYLMKSNQSYIEDPNNWPVIILLSFVPALIIWADSIGKPKKDIAILGRAQAKYPPIPKQLSFKKPEGFCFGKDKKSGRYVCKPLSEDGHIMIIGGSGTGKSSTLIIPTLMANKSTGSIVLDIKGELSAKSVDISDENVMIFNPADRSSYGYDPLYMLKDGCTSQEIMETMQTIAFSLIQISADLKDPFWKNCSRSLLIGLMTFYYKQGSKDYISIIDKILSRPIKESIEEALEMSSPQSVEYRYLIQFKDMADETLGGIIAEMNNHIMIFSTDQDIRFALKENPLKLSPADIEKYVTNRFGENTGNKIFIAIKEEKLTAYYDVLILIINQFLNQLEHRSENSKDILFILDELPRTLSAGKIDRLLDAARTLRSRRCHMVYITQSLEALQTSYSDAEVTDLLSNCAYTICLGASSVKTIEAISKWAGRFLARKQSWSGSTSGAKANVSFDEQDIVRASDLMTLNLTGEAILISPYGYSRILKTPYYKDRIFKSIAQEIHEKNESILDIKRKESE
ncbi:MAG: type IV secretory system conjugative DNA transfer family protein [Lachnospiraceae bacterium]|nr:type IV secretory system conjugative DNA transfer family protein [Lachnospiraceae bacterium]